MAALLTGCASSGAKKAAGSVHPRSYVLDPIDAGDTANETPAANWWSSYYRSLKRLI